MDKSDCSAMAIWRKSFPRAVLLPIQKAEGAPIREAHTSFRVLESRKVAALSAQENLTSQLDGNGDTLTLIAPITPNFQKCFPRLGA